MDATERSALLARLGELLDTHPDLAGRATYEVAYVTRVSVVRA
jgi:hypothetical protein